MKNVRSIVGVFGLLTGVAYGHAGHGATEGMSLLHYFVEPAHGLAAVALVALALVATKRMRAAKQYRR